MEKARDSSEYMVNSYHFIVIRAAHNNEEILVSAGLDCFKFHYMDNQTLTCVFLTLFKARSKLLVASMGDTDYVIDLIV